MQRQGRSVAGSGTASGDFRGSSGMSRIYVLHENDEWVEPLRTALDARRLPFDEWFLDTGVVDFGTRRPTACSTTG